MPVLAGSTAGRGSSQSVHSTVLGGGSTAARNSSVRPGAGTAANPGLLDKQRAESGIVRIPADEVSTVVCLVLWLSHICIVG